MENRACMNRKALFVDLLANAILPTLAYECLRGWAGFSEFRALLWVTLIPVAYGLAVLLWQRRVSLVAGCSLASLLMSLLCGLFSQDVRMLQIRESFCSALFGLIFLGSQWLGRPLIYYLMLEQVTEPMARERLQSLIGQPAGREFLALISYGVGALGLGEFAIKWWMIEHLPISTVLWAGPLVIKAMCVLLFVFIVLARRRFQRVLMGGRA